jgi:peptidoglycan/xylan/chitin deacetylase (PgdA/CDA1 family)
MAKVTLTFDNGPTPDVTHHVLDVLDAHGVKATFFPIGRNLAAGPEHVAAIRRAHAAGHWIGNHTFTHATPLGEQHGDDVPEREIGRAQALIEPFAHPDRLFRPFGGGGRIGPWLLSPACRRFLIDGGYSMVLWNAVPRDWDDPDGWAETALAQCAGTEWAVVVLHDLPTGAMQHLDGFLYALADRGDTMTQGFPDDCVPIRRGQAVSDVSGFVSAA